MYLHAVKVHMMVMKTKVKTLDKDHLTPFWPGNVLRSAPNCGRKGIAPEVIPPLLASRGARAEQEAEDDEEYQYIERQHIAEALKKCPLVNKELLG